MPSLPVSLRQSPSFPRALSVPPQALPQAPSSAAAPRRDRIWDLSPTLHCSVVGTCLTTGELRRLFAKLDHADAQSASDHALHGRAVSAAGHPDLAGKLLNKMLDKRHEAPIKRFAKAKTSEAVRDLWREALDRGEIPGAYWAVLTHPCTGHALVQEAFGDVHMLSHLVGTSTRADITRLRQLERDLAERDEKILRQEALLRRKALEQGDLIRRIGDVEAELTHTRATLSRQAQAPAEVSSAVLKSRLADEQARSIRLAGRVAELEQALDAKTRHIRGLEDQASILGQELASLEGALAESGSKRKSGAEPPSGLDGRRILYVGGRPKQIEQVRAVTETRGGTLLSHDGGIEDNTALLPGLVSQADLAMFPVDCVSHLAAGQVKRLCREAGKPFMPLRSASLASFVAAVAMLNDTSASAPCGCASHAALSWR